MSFVSRRLMPALLIIALALAVPGMPGRLASAEAQAPERYAAVVMNAQTGEILFDRHARAPRFPASITKVMTLYMVFEALAEGRISLDDPVRMSARAAAQPPTKLGLAAGRTLTVDQAIQALAVRSANDVAVALAEHMSGSVEAFGRASTTKAHELGMVQSTFVNPHGLPDPRNVSTALDLALLSQAVMRDYPQYYRYFGLHSWVFEGREIRTTNGLLLSGAGVDGIKTGFTRASGYNLAASSVRDGRRLITVVLGGQTSASRNAHVDALMRTGFQAEAERQSGGQTRTAQAFFESRGFGIDGTSQVRFASSPRPYSAGVGATGYAEVPAQTVFETAVANTTADTANAASARAAIPAPGLQGWAIQVGAFREPDVAQEWLASIARRFPDVTASARPVVETAAPWHRSRFVGLDKDSADRACAALTARRVSCLIFAPEGGR